MNINMDSFVSKLRKTVSEVAYQVNTSVNTIIPGNLIHREYEILKLRCTHGCPGFIWSVFDAVKRDSSSIKASLKDAIGPNLLPQTEGNHMPSSSGENLNTFRQLYSVFVFEKHQLDSIQNKAEKEAALEHIKKAIVQLTRLRHPAILTVHHPLEESRSSLAFVSEHVYGNLDSILKAQRSLRAIPKDTKSRKEDEIVNLSQDLGPKDSDYQDDSCHLDEVQIKAGLLQVCDGLKFLHNDAKMIHRNLCLDNIFVDSNNTWKIAGFDFCCLQLKPESISSNSSTTPNSSLQIIEFNPKISNSPSFPSLKTMYPPLPSNIVPNWSCSAPEHSNTDHVSFSSDIFSLGIISCALLTQDKDMIDLSYEYGLISDTYKRGLHFRELADKLPTGIKSSIMKYAAMNLDSRPSLDDYQNLTLFNDYHVKAIRDLDNRYTWDRFMKIDFFNRLREILPNLSHQVKVNRVAKSLFNEVVDSEMVPHILPCIMIIAKDSTPSEFKLKIFPNLKGPLRILEPKSVPLMLLDNMAVLADRAKLCLPEFQQSAFTLIQYLLKMDQQLQEKCLLVLPNIRRFIDATSMSDIILPGIDRLYRETTILSVRIKCLECIDKLVDVMDESTIIKKVLPLISDIPTQEPDVIMATTSVIKSVINSSKSGLTKDVLGNRILPFLIPLSLAKDLNLQQFDSIIGLVRKLLDRVEREQRELLSRKSQTSIPKSNPLVLNTFKGSSHFLID